MQRSYSELINLAIELGQYRGYLDTNGKKEQLAFQGRYEAALRAFVFDLLKDGKSAEAATGEVDRDFAEISAASDAGYIPVYDEVKDDIVSRIDREAQKKPWQRTLRQRLPILIGLLLVVSYGGVRLYNATPVDQAIETRQGLQQRAYALDKALQYDEWTSTQVRRGGWFRGLLLWPIEPTDAELKGASEMAGLIFDGASELQKAGQACNVPMPVKDAPLADDSIALLRSVTAHLRDDKTKWSAPPVMTVLEPIRLANPC